ncbi:MAG TPA: antibiotic biosynthesis monooxygenase family protein [Arenicellales bacterium]|nr:antibiotic biosynthesis monooxygenase family protein [Arenicellales bacterium]
MSDSDGALFVVSNRVPVAPAWREEFERRFRRRAGQIDSQPGFVRMEIHRPADADSPYVVQTVWRDQASFRAWVGSDDFKAAHAHPMPKEAFDGDSRMEQHEVIIAT